MIIDTEKLREKVKDFSMQCLTTCNTEEEKTKNKGRKDVSLVLIDTVELLENGINDFNNSVKELTNEFTEKTE